MVLSVVEDPPRVERMLPHFTPPLTSPLSSAEVILESHDVALIERLTMLHFDEDKELGTGVRNPVGRAGRGTR